MKVIVFNAKPAWESSAAKKKQMLTRIGKPNNTNTNNFSSITLSLFYRRHHLQGEEDGHRGSRQGTGEARKNSNSTKRKVQGQSVRKAGRKRRGGDDGTIGRRHYVIAQISFSQILLSGERRNKVRSQFPISIVVCLFVYSAENITCNQNRANNAFNFIYFERAPPN
jgi:hypothetical protein